MTKRSESGSGARRTALDLEDVHLKIAGLVKAAIEDLTDGDNDVRQALIAINDIGYINYQMNDIQVSIADGQLLDAEVAAQRLAAAEQPGTRLIAR